MHPPENNPPGDANHPPEVSFAQPGTSEGRDGSQGKEQARCEGVEKIEVRRLCRLSS
jgi:hypothetical protein